jgi:hypothetical protein
MGVQIMFLVEFELNFEKTHSFVIESLIDANRLSDEVLKMDFTNGSYFTFLPQGSVVDNIYNFETDLVFEDNSKLMTVSSVRTLNRNCLGSLLIDEVKKSRKNYCVFDDLLSEPDEILENDPQKGDKYLYNDQVYYILNRANITLDALVHYLHISNAFWHSLCLLTSGDIEMKENELSESALREISSNAQLIIVGAYDGEGYIIWKRSDFKFPITWEVSEENPY